MPTGADSCVRLNTAVRPSSFYSISIDYSKPLEPKKINIL